MPDTNILVAAVEAYVAAMSKEEFDALVEQTRDPEESNATSDSNTIAARMFGENQ